MVQMIEILFWIAIGVLSVPTLVFSAEVALALLPARATPGGARPSCVVLIPAHNEAGLIGDTVRSVLGLLASGDRVVVVADNCTDETANEAERAGAEVVVRADESRRGKGYAVAAGVESLAAGPPKVVVVLDADCEPEPGAIDTIVRACAMTGRPIQATYLMRAPTPASVGDRVSALAFRFKNQIRPRGLARVGAPCLLTGSGMAFAYERLAECTLATGDIVEDMKLGVDLALAGGPPIAVSDAVVWSVLPGSDDARQSQRTRWEHGHIASLLAHAPRLFGRGIARGKPSLCVLACELAVPPMSLMLLLTGAVAVLAGGAWLAGANALPALIAGGLLGLCGAAVLAGWARFGRGDVSVVDLLFAPVYAVGKVPVYMRAFTRRQKSWVRTARDHLPPDQGSCTQ